MNTNISYLYRDGCNYKNRKNVIVKGAITDKDRQVIANSLNDHTYFIPQQVGLPDAHFDDCDLSPSDHCWCELKINDPRNKDYDPNAKDDVTLTEEEPTLDLTIGELVEAFRKAAGNWEDYNYAIVVEEKTMNDAINEAIIRGKWTVHRDVPTSVTVFFTNNAGRDDETELDLYEENKRAELIRLWDSLKDELNAASVELVKVLGYINEPEDEDGDTAIAET